MDKVWNRRARRAVLLGLALTLSLAGLGGCGGDEDPVVFVEVEELDPIAAGIVLRDWSAFVVDRAAVDHTFVEPGETRVYGENFGPVRTARAYAITHVAMFEAVNAVTRRYESYVHVDPAGDNVSVEAAIAQAARDSSVAMWPSQQSLIDAELVARLAEIPDGDAKAAGIALGRAAAAAILANRENDGGNGYIEDIVDLDYITSPDPGRWRLDPVGQIPFALGSRWAMTVPPFALNTAWQFRVPPPPALDSPEYAAAYNEVMELGGDGVTTPTTRTPEQSVIGIYWAYDAAPEIGVPPRLYSQIARQVLYDEGVVDVSDLARALALVHLAMADCGLGAWDSKYFHDFWRPVVGIREADVGTGPTGLGDGNPMTVGDPTFTPLGSPSTNELLPTFSPPFPAYPSGHATFGAGTFRMVERILGRDQVTFTFVSDEFNGVNRDNMGNVRPRVERTYTSLSQAAEENGQSRIYLGIHWSFDKEQGIALGGQIADWIYDRFLQAR